MCYKKTAAENRMWGAWTWGAWTWSKNYVCNNVLYSYLAYFTGSYPQ